MVVAGGLEEVAMMEYAWLLQGRRFKLWQCVEITQRHLHLLF